MRKGHAGLRGSAAARKAGLGTSGLQDLAGQCRMDQTFFSVADALAKQIYEPEHEKA